MNATSACPPTRCVGVFVLWLLIIPLVMALEDATIDRLALLDRQSFR
jgi:hypothetical protein